MPRLAVRNARLAPLLFAACACGAASPPVAQTSAAATTTAAASSGNQAEPPIEAGSERDAQVEPAITVVGEELSYAGRPVGGVSAAQLTRTLATVQAKLAAAKKYWGTQHQSPFPTTLAIELSEQQRALLLKELLKIASTADFADVELSVTSKGRSEHVRFTLRSPEWQDSPRITKRLHVTVAPPNRYLLAWLEGDTVVSTPYRELFAAPPAGLDLTAFLAEKLNEEWNANGMHRAAMDRVKDVAVLHVNDALTLDALLIVTRALGTPTRKWQFDDQVADAPAFELYVSLD
jgi:hypothetical protein